MTRETFIYSHLQEIEEISNTLLDLLKNNVVESNTELEAAVYVCEHLCDKIENLSNHVHHIEEQEK